MHDNFLDKLATTITDSQDLESLARPLLAILQEITDLESTFLTSVDLQRNELTLVYTHNTSSLQIPEGRINPWCDTLCKRAMDDGVIHTDAAHQLWPDNAIGRELGIVTYLSEPLCTSDGELYGTLCGASSSQRKISSRSRRLLSMFGRLLIQQIERERLIAQLQVENQRFSKAALQDPLTRIPNRRAMEQELTRTLANASRNQLQTHLAFIDLDDFKAINDRYGHDFGDRFLLEISANLTNRLREGDFVARYGGDEFVFFCATAQGSSESQRQAITDRLRSLTQGRFKIEDIELDYAGPSIGVVSALPNESGNQLLARADRVMYDQKAARKTASGSEQQ
ncbi:sensor domain-containing diguanylate cyclase [Halopseudomonas salina]|uniref:diguanylate cyclase n=1 Tax=Halopseudomonas salina TaxID=1323744 RepID=A0ABQ1PRC3_9GAMM|nr:sensor domain-containing diguanylate cyclase [Halopseudomonas salina]GGD01722.1 GGDEF domain-containing protein [Halopseudomonas salina]